MVGRTGLARRGGGRNDPAGLPAVRGVPGPLQVPVERELWRARDVQPVLGGRTKEFTSQIVFTVTIILGCFYS